MGLSLPKIKNDEQDRTSEAWLKLCAYIDELAENGGDVFEPLMAIGGDLFAQIYTLPESIGKLKKVTKIWLYGSNLKRIPPEIGQMESLEYFDVYTSYDLRWFPYEMLERDYTTSIGTKIILDATSESTLADSPKKDVPLLKVIRRI
jgi:hypothetical protein